MSFTRKVRDGQKENCGFTVKSKTIPEHAGKRHTPKSSKIKCHHFISIIPAVFSITLWFSVCFETEESTFKFI